MRFALTVTAPVAFAWIAGPQPWLVYALVSAITSFACDTGGRALPRLLWMTAGPAAILVGAGLGTLVAGNGLLIVVTFAMSGALYALTESAHPLTLTASRFMCFSLGIGALFSPLRAADVPALLGACLLAWAISAGWDAARRVWRPSEAPTRADLRSILRGGDRRRWAFVAAVAITIPLACWISIEIGLQRPYWPLLALVLVLRLDFLTSRNLMVERFLGTLLGVIVAAGYAALFASPVALMIGIVAAALARWPAQQKHGVLGVGALTAFVMLMLELMIASRGEALLLLEERVVDTAVGCLYALLALSIDRVLWRLLPKCRSYNPR